MCYNDNMSRRNYKIRYPKRRKRLTHGRSRAGAWLKFIAIFLGVVLALAVVALGVMFVLEAFFKIDTPLKPDGFLGGFASRFNKPLVESPTPYVTEVPTPTPYPMDLFVGEDEERELVFPAEFSYSYLGDPYCFSNTVVCSAGKLIDGSVRLYKLVEFSLDSGGVRELPIAPQNDHLLFPVFNEKWLVYFDANASVGGGYICALDRTSRTARPFVIKEVYIGQPKIRLAGNYITWVERTGSEREKIFVCDLSSEETTVIQYFNNSDYGTSMPSFGGGRLIWASDDGVGNASSAIRMIDLDSSSVSEYKPGVYVHDPEYNGSRFAWMDTLHSEDAKLYISDGENEPFAVAEGIVEFGLSESFVAYGKDNAVFIYVFENGQTYRITPERETTQLLGVSGGVVLWMDVTSRERDIIKYAVPPA